ncbi:hypothetical protein MNY64_18280 (plasmid) [Moellerella wisconsensis]|uniref:hypothetical protein n=1 Tax=Moellerella wisconsensis TaxID=158849 RepID=UPI001F4E4214|nr:hypothetical protein [Moellerella wisconsensis]UNH29334.1 hypothetical protein MNY64_18280 [Moellerella wisconsensis]
MNITIDRQCNLMMDVHEMIGDSLCCEDSPHQDRAIDCLGRARKGVIIALADFIPLLNENEYRVKFHYLLSEVLTLVEIAKHCVEVSE